MPWIKKEGKKIVEIYEKAQYGRDDLIFVKDTSAILKAHKESQRANTEIEMKIRNKIVEQTRAAAIAELKKTGDIPNDYAD